MTRGKHGSQMARLRAEAAHSEAVRLRAELAEERRAHHTDTQDLMAQVVALRSQIRAEAERVASEAVAAARKEAAEAVRAGKERHDARVEAVVAVLTGADAPGDALSLAQWTTLADALGVQIGRLYIQDATLSRGDRRRRTGGRVAVENMSPEVRARMGGIRRQAASRRSRSA